MSSREDILARVRRNQPAPQPLPAVPTFDRDLPSPVEAFKANLARMGGSVVEAPAEVAGNRPIDQVTNPAELADVDVGIVRAGFGVAETGSVFLTEDHFKVNALGFLSQHLVVLLDTRDIVPNLHHAYRQLPRISRAF